MSVETFVLGFQTAQMLIQANLAGVSHEESLMQPTQAGNCINWLAGHLLTSREGLLGMLNAGGPVLAEDAAKPYQQGASPLRPEDSCVQLEQLAEGLSTSSEALLSRLKGMTDEDLESLLDPKLFPVPVEKPSLGTMLTLMLFHEAYHAGQIGLGRRLLGKPSGLGI